MFNKRIWLNPEDSSSTGSIVAFSGEPKWEVPEGARRHASFLEIADCHGKVRLHRSSQDTKDDYISKMKLLKDTLEEYIGYLENEQEPEK